MTPARVARRIALTVAGATVTGVGVALLVLPGPGFVVVAGGLFILSLEYEWARSAFERARKKAADLADQAANNTVSSAFTFIFAAAMITGGVFFCAGGDVTLGPYQLSSFTLGPFTFGGLTLGVSVILSGLIVAITLLVSLRQAAAAKRNNRPTDADLIAARRARNSTLS